MSDETAKLIDNEIRKIIDIAENHAKKVLKKNIKHLHNLAKALLEYETLSGDEVKELIKKGKFKANNVKKMILIKKHLFPQVVEAKIKPKSKLVLILTQQLLNK